MRSVVRSAVVPLVIATLCSACSLDRTGLLVVDGGGFDAGSDAAPDATLDAAPDAELPDTGPPDVGCATFEDPTELWAVARAEFEDPASVLMRSVVEPPGVLVLRQQRHRHGALLFGGYDRALIDETGDLGAIERAAPVGLAPIGDLDEAWGGFTDNFGQLGIDGDDVYSALGRGDVFLTAGTHEIAITADDIGVIEITVDGTAHRAVGPSFGVRGTASVPVATEGWYRVRVGWTDTGRSSFIRVEHTTPDGRTGILSPAILRADLSAYEGRELVGFQGGIGATPSASRIDPDDTEVDWGAGRPASLEILSDDGWGVRWLGRHLLPVADAEFTADTDGKHRLWMDGIYLGGEYGFGTLAGAYPTRAGPGFHEVVFELDEMSGDAMARFRYGGNKLDAPALRPLTRFGGMPFGAGTTPSDPNVDPGTQRDASATLLAPPVVAVAIEGSAIVETTEPDAVAVEIVDVRGFTTSATVASSAERIGTTDRYLFRVLHPMPEALSSTAGNWTIRVRNDGAAPARFLAGGVLVHIGGVARPYATEGTFEAVPRVFADRSRITSIRAVAHAVFGTTVELRVRAADVPALLMGAPWVTAAPDGTLPWPVAGTLVQVGAVLRGPGNDTPRVESIAIAGGACLE